ncbi:MAG: hypothetical protein H6718_30760 [Polyangiaceae bacterium]|nr:hypothetical protein [Myxococcales bacterium]MCB9589836.1 hypothetical protein [Polyangiaceae bacterium]
MGILGEQSNAALRRLTLGVLLVGLTACQSQQPAASPEVRVPASTEPEAAPTASSGAEPVALAVDTCNWETWCIETGTCAEGCNAGDLVACYGQASMTSDTELGQETLEKALERCPEGDVAACWAVLALHNVGFEVDDSVLFRMAVRGCEANCSESCLDAADHACQLRAPGSADYSPERAKRYLERACKLGSQVGCDGAAGKGAYRCN